MTTRAVSSTRFLLTTTTLIIGVLFFLSMGVAQASASYAYKEAVLEDDPLSYYSLSPGSSGLEDQGSAGEEGTCSGERSEVESPVEGGPPGSELTGSSCILDSEVPFVGQFTVEAWVRFNRSPELNDEAWFLKPGNYQLTLNGYAKTPPNAEFAALRENAYYSFGKTLVGDSRWYQVAIEQTETEKLLYVDGALDARRPLTPLTTPGKYDRGLKVNPYLTSNPIWSLEGAMAQISVYDRALPAERIAAHYVAGVAGFGFSYEGPVQIHDGEEVSVAPTILGTGTGWQYEAGSKPPTGLSVNPESGAIEGVLDMEGASASEASVVVKASKLGHTTTAKLTLDLEPTTLAQRFRPELRFDRDEKWRPLDVDHFLESGDFEVCSPEENHCSAPLQGPNIAEALRRASYEVYPYETHIQEIEPTANREEGPFYDSPELFTGDCVNAGEYGAAAFYTTNECVNDPEASALYFKEIGGAGGEHFIDYWAFYRYNELELDDHQGDWEHVFVALPPGENPSTFDYVGFSAHSHVWEYLRDTLACDKDLSQGSCGENAHRVIDYVAKGSHANYPVECESACKQTAPDEEGANCDAHVEDNVSVCPEGAAGGQVEWEQDGTGSVLKPLPANNGGWDQPTYPEGKEEGYFGEDTNWTDWLGRWGADEEGSDLGLGLGNSPGSPGVQGQGAGRWEEWETGSYEPDCTSRYSDETCDSTPSAQWEANESTAWTACAPWEGPDVVMSVCDGQLLEAAESNYEMSPSGALFSISSSPSLGRSGAARGIAQLVASTPLRPGNAVRIRGTVPAGAVIKLEVAADAGGSPSEELVVPPHEGDLIVRIANTKGASGVRLYAAHDGRRMLLNPHRRHVPMRRRAAHRGGAIGLSRAFVAKNP